MMSLNTKAIAGSLFLLLVIGALLFGPAGTLDYWQANVFLAVFGASMLAITLYLMKYDRNLLRRRISGGPFAEKEARQKIIMFITSAGFIAMFVVSGLDHRWHWSVVTVLVVLAGDVLVITGWLAIYFVFKENTFAASTVVLAADQKVISTGPYAIVRHPMYAGALLYLFGIPIALGSWWGLAVVFLILPALLWRLIDEEQFLAKNLPGYADYKGRVKYRMLPYIW